MKRSINPKQGGGFVKKALRRTVSGLLCLILLAAALPLPRTAFAAALMAGDVDFDGRVTASDARTVLRNAVGLEKLSDDALRCADADRDNTITASDARLVLRAAVGLETLKPVPEKAQTIVCLLDKIPETALTFPGGKAQTLGSFNKTGMTITAEPDSLPKGAKLKATPLDAATLKSFKLTSKTERVIFPMKIECSGYDGSFFDDGVRITMPLMEEGYGKDTGYNRFFFCYYDETAKTVRWLIPDEIDAKNHTMTVSLPHFSYWWGAKATEEEALEQYLDRTCTEMAVSQANRQKAAAELEPYLKAKAEALGLTKQAAKDLVECAVNYIGGSFSFEDPAKEYTGDYISIGTNFTSSMIRAYYEKDASRAKESLSGAADAALLQAWKQLKYSERAGKVFKNEYIREFIPSSVDTLISSFGEIGSVLGAIKEGDAEGALEAVGSIMQNALPEAGLATKAVAFVANGVNTSFTYWKANQIEELYQLYKNGGRYLFGNEVLPRDRVSFLRHLNTSSGFTAAKGVKRFYNMDKIGEICKKYGWSFQDYASMPQKYRDIFEQRAENGLLEYFETRIKQEAAAEKLKAQERECIRAMLDDDMGALRCTNYGSFFGESAAEYSLMTRFLRLQNIRRILSAYVDEEKLARDKYQNWGRILNLWVHYITTEPTREDALNRFLLDLKRLGLLKAGVEVALSAEIDAFFGKWSVDIHTETKPWVDYVNGVIHDGVIIDARYIIEVRRRSDGSVEVARTIGSPFNDDGSRYAVPLDGTNCEIVGKTLIINSKSIPGWLRLTLLSEDSLSYRELGADGSTWCYTLKKQ